MNFVKLYIGDYLRDTGTLSVVEHGAYMLMLLHHYATEQPLPTGRELHRLLRAETKADREAIDAMAAKFWTATDAGLVNSRAGKEFARAEHQRTINQAIGKLGGRPKRTESKTESVSESVSESQPNHNPNHSQTPDTKEIHPPTPRKRGQVFDASAIDLPDWLPREPWARWCADRKDRRKPITAEGAKGQIARLDRLRAEGHAPAAVIGHAIASGYQGLFAPPRDGGAPVTDFARQRREQIHAMSGGLASAKPLQPEPETIDGIGIVRAVG